MYSECSAQQFAGDIAIGAKVAIEDIRTEIQDDGKFLLVSIVFPNFSSDETVAQVLKIAQSLADKSLPTRRTAYSWMVNALRGGHVVNSVFGGDESSPRSGLIEDA
jgi:hypothetical protein